MKIVINDSAEGFSLSKEAYEFLGLNWTEDVEEFLERLSPGILKVGKFGGFAYKDERTNPDLVRCVETLGLKASGPNSHLVVIDVDIDRPWELQNDGGWERIKYLDEE